MDINSSNAASLRRDNSILNNPVSTNARVQVIDQSEVGKLDQNAFLNMLLTQLQNQDPLNPLDNTEFAAQLAQYSSLEQLTSIGSKLDNITQLILSQIATENNSTPQQSESNSTNSNSSNDSKAEDKDNSGINTITFTRDFLYSDNESISKLNSILKETFNKNHITY